MKTLLISGLVTGAMLLTSVSADAQTRLRVAGNFPMDHTATGAMEVFKERIEDLSGGTIQVDNFPAMQLGGPTENVDQVRSGAIFAVFTSIAYFTRTVPELEAVSLPFLFSDRDKAFEVMDGPVGTLMDEKLLETGFVNMGYMELGFRHATNNVRPITTAADFDGLRIRLQPNQVHLDSFRALGANPQAMDVSELYSALQQGVLDGQENPYNIIFTRRFNEVQTHLSDSGHFFDFINIVANQRAFENLTEEQQGWVREAMRDAVLWQRDAARDLDEGFREQLIASGMQFTPISPEGRETMRQATMGIAEDLKARVDPSVIDMVLTAATE
jgi:tripartite ATP-independent transporter DctP family solute receptor